MMQFFSYAFSSYKNIDDLDKNLRFIKFSERLLDNRARYKIAVLDDGDFTAAENLRKNGYHITHLSDINSIENLEKYDIILCDLMGVGTALNPTLQGAHIIAELKKNYPEKIVIAYTGGLPEQRHLETATQQADRFLKKDINIEEWSSALDEAIINLANPATVWKKMRHRMLDAGFSPLQLTRLEDSFVRKVMAGKKFSTKELEKESIRLNITISPSIKVLFDQLTRLGVLAVQQYLQNR